MDSPTPYEEIALILTYFHCEKCQAEFIPENCDSWIIQGKEAEDLGWHVEWIKDRNDWLQLCPKCSSMK